MSGPPLRDRSGAARFAVIPEFRQTARSVERATAASD